MRNLLLILSGPSGVGKGTVVNRLKETGRYLLSISCTTRGPRGTEKNGVDYHFISEEEFLKRLGEGGFLEYSNHLGAYYGTPRPFVEEGLKTHNVILEIDVDGAQKVKEIHPEAVTIMLAPPDMPTLRARLESRGTEDGKSVDERLERAKYELTFTDRYDYVVINDVLDDAVEQIQKIIEKESKK